MAGTASGDNNGLSPYAYWQLTVDLSQFILSYTAQQTRNRLSRVAQQAGQVVDLYANSRLPCILGAAGQRARGPAAPSVLPAP